MLEFPSSPARRIEELIARCRKVVAAGGFPFLPAVFLYGSALGQEFRADSDIDVAVLDQAQPRLGWNDQARLMDALEREIGRGVDLRMLRDLSLSHQAHVLKEGHLVWAPEPSKEARQFRHETLASFHRSQRHSAEEWRQLLGRLAHPEPIG